MGTNTNVHNITMFPESENLGHSILNGIYATRPYPSGSDNDMEEEAERL